MPEVNGPDAEHKKPEARVAARLRGRGGGTIGIICHIHICCELGHVSSSILISLLYIIFKHIPIIYIYVARQGNNTTILIRAMLMQLIMIIMIMNMYIYIYTLYNNICIYIYIYTHTAYVYAYIYIYVNMYIYICI